MLETAATTVKLTHITAVTLRLDVTASAEHIPKICSAIGFSLKIGFNRMSLILLAKIKPPLRADWRETEKIHFHPSRILLGYLPRGLLKLLQINHLFHVLIQIDSGLPCL